MAKKESTAGQGKGYISNQWKGLEHYECTAQGCHFDTFSIAAIEFHVESKHGAAPPALKVDAAGMLIQEPGPIGPPSAIMAPTITTKEGAK